MSKVRLILTSLLFGIVCASGNLQAQTTLTGLTFSKASVIGGSTDTIMATLTIQRDPNDNHPIFINLSTDVPDLALEYNSSQVIQPGQSSVVFFADGNFVSADSVRVVTAVCTNIGGSNCGGRVAQVKTWGAPLKRSLCGIRECGFASAAKAVQIHNS